MTDVLIIARCLTVPVGFVDLSQDDQLILIKVGFFELWLCYVSRLATDLSLTFYDGTFITRQQLELIYDVRLNLKLKVYSVKNKKYSIAVANNHSDFFLICLITYSLNLNDFLEILLLLQ